MQLLINDFIESIKTEGKSKCTLQAYRLDLKEFAEFFKDMKVHEIRYTDLNAWNNNLERNNLCASSRARKIACIKSFFRYLVKVEVVEKNPSEILESPKLEKKQPIVISTKEAAELLFYARNDGGRNMLWFRDYTIMAVFLYTGVRREEITNISLNDIDLKKDTILIYGKGNKQRIVYINESLHPILSEYLLHYRGLLSRSIYSNFLFPSTKADKLSLASINNIVNRFFESSGIKEKGISAHILRKRFATSVFENTGDIALTSKLLGHSSPTVTMRYVAMNEDSMRKATNCVNF